MSTFEVIVETKWEVKADSLAEAQAIADDGAVEFNGHIIDTDVVSVHEVRP